MNNYYRSIASEEMSDFEAFYREMASQLPNNAWIAELGIADGRGVIMMASLMNDLQKNCTIWAVDNFSNGNDYQRNVFATNVRNSGETTIEAMDMDSLAAACRCQDEQFNMVFIDSSHQYEQTRAEIMLWFHKVKTTGILAGHDYQGIAEVKRAVDEMIPGHALRMYDTSNGHGVWWMVKTPDIKLLK